MAGATPAQLVRIGLVQVVLGIVLVGAALIPGLGLDSSMKLAAAAAGALSLIIGPAYIFVGKRRQKA